MTTSPSRWFVLLAPLALAACNTAGPAPQASAPPPAA